MKHSIALSMFTYKPRLIGEGGFSLRVAYQLNYVFRMQNRSFTYKPRGFLPGSYGTKAAGQAEVFFMIFVTQSIMLTRPMHTNSLWQQ